MSRARAALLLAAFAAAHADDADIGVHAHVRDTGYLLGDLVEETVELALPHGAELDAGSLPAPGRVLPWLEVRDARAEPRRGDAQIVRVTYQVFAEVEQVTRLAIPAFKLGLRGDGTRSVEVPPQSFVLSPALPAALTDEDRELRPSPPPAPLPQRGALFGALGGLLAAFACAGWLLWRYDRLPFLPRSAGPLVRAWRRWRRARMLGDAEHAALLRDLHRALNQSAGETLYPSTLARLFERAPHLRPLRDEIEPLFARSWNCFYGPPGAAPPGAEGVLALLHRAADRERGVPC
ncbi:MAG TPA: hypothetical protein VGC30_10145 [Dokdonella sp.]